MRRRPASRGLSYFDANKNRLITEAPDVLEIKREIEARWPGVLECFFDKDREEWVVVEHCKDGTDRLALATSTLSMRTVEKLQRMDQASHPVDLNDELEKQQRELDREKDHRFHEATGEANERLFHALCKDGLIHRPKTFVL